MVDWLLGLQGGFLYVGIFFALLGGAFGLPIPEDIPLLLSGVLLHRGNCHLTSTFLTCYFGILIGDIIVFSIGRKIGRSARSRGWLNLKISPETIEKTKKALEKRSFITILLARHLFYLRTVTFLTCGALKMSYKSFIISDAFAALISSTFMLSFGFMFAEHYDKIIGIFSTAKITSLFLILFLIAAAFIYYLLKRKPSITEKNPNSLE